MSVVTFMTQKKEIPTVALLQEHRLNPFPTTGPAHFAELARTASL